MTSVLDPPQSPSVHPAEYEQDFAAWADTTAQLLAQRRFNELDLVNLIDEVQDLSRRERQALSSNLKIVLLHLLKWDYQPRERLRLAHSWKSSIREHRQRLEEQLAGSPSLKRYLQDNFAKCYQKARLLAADESGLSEVTFPQECPYSIEQTLDETFLPENSAAE